MVLSSEELEQVSKYASLNLDPDEIAVIMGLEVLSFCQLAKEQGSRVETAIKRGLLLLKAERNEKAKASPRYLKEINDINREQELKKMIRDFFELNQLKSPHYPQRKIDNYTFEEIQAYRKTRSSDKLDIAVQRYVDYLDAVAEVFPRVNGRINAASRMLIDRFPEDKLPFTTAKYIVYDAINFFYLNSNISARAWSNYYAHEELPRLLTLALQSGNLQLSFDIMRERNKVIAENQDNSIPEEMLKPHQIFINPDIAPERLGMNVNEYQEIMTEFETFVQKRDLDKDERERIINEIKREINIDAEPGNYTD